MTDLWIHPALILLLGAALLPLIPERVRPGYLLLVPILVFARVHTMAPGTYGEVPFLSWTLTFGRVDALASVFGYIMALMAIIGTLYALKVKKKGEFAAAWVYVAGSLGAIYAGDLITLFVFWEMMAFSSVFLIWFRGRKESLEAGFRYLLVHAAGGVSLLAGILLYSRGAENLAFVGFNVQSPGLGEWLILIGFMLNAAVPPLHAWLPDGYGEATFSGAVFLCAFTTKTAVYALARGFAGLEILIWLGVIMALYGVVYAVLENDSRRLLAYHIISQVGYMVAGVGIGTQLAINGVCAHAFAHILYKGLLFMGCGAVLHMTGQSKFTELGGLYRKMPWTFVFTLIGGLSISAFPLFSGFVSKAMTVQAGFDEHMLWAAFLLMLASAGTFLHTGLKVPYFIWFGKNNCKPETWERAADPPWNMNAAMAITAALCIFIGVYTPYLYDMLPYPTDYNPYTSYHLSETMQLLLFTMLGFFLLLKKLEPKAAIAVDTDWFYRRGGQFFYRAADKGLNGLNQTGDKLAMRRLPSSLTRFFAKPGAHLQWLLLRPFVRGGEGEIAQVRESIDRRSRHGSYPVGTSVLLSVLFLSLMSLLFFLF
ncbi:Na(+)/H(+) antiporter subunit D [Geoalkalibacter halelectricus]|uniref:Na(+)/H(+) antiporter subunit D n=1 Tax=Geoalkalibacter halelectricus TaxID=2847045 RepID=A0ABY5ZJL2_9BACT|nr:Na(+)/H(+) antiporter subunit D [Geoalkalibacter halelectricus]MDO3378315.1 Na(+)/H(+) antiporter subunit D [Geoalkalibacter halelectricus]UWZ79320.1 Na(+)/H(+) antiporter subunit D [Geoalkalibacter halelectricus]